MLRTIKLIARREGIGNLLAEGAAMAAKQIGHGAEGFAMHVKGVEFPMHEPRLNKALGLGYMVNPHGADHCDSLIDIFFSAFGDQPNVTIPDTVPLGLDLYHSMVLSLERSPFSKLFNPKGLSVTPWFFACFFLTLLPRWQS